MNFHKGNWRYVVTIPTLGIAIKFGRISLIGAICDTCKVLSSKNRGLRRIFFIGAKTEQIKFLPDLLFGGIKRNWSEFCFYLCVRHKFCQPTYFSLFGLINIQKYGSHCPVSDFISWEALWSICKDEIIADHHHFRNADNFTISGGTIKIFDYSSRYTQKIIKKFGDDIVLQFATEYAKKSASRPAP